MDAVAGSSSWERIKSHAAEKARQAGRPAPLDAITRGPSGPIDSVDSSPLAGALKGNALTLFNKALGDKDRARVAELVNTGAVAADEVSKALIHSLKHIGTMGLVMDAEEANHDNIQEDVRIIHDMGERMSALAKGPDPAVQAAVEETGYAMAEAARTYGADSPQAAAAADRARKAFTDYSRALFGDPSEGRRMGAALDASLKKAFDAAGPDKIRYLHTREDGGPEAVSKLLDHGVALGALNAYGDAVRGLMKAGEISYS